MSGHSKWHNIQARKGKQDAKRGNVFSKFSKIITIAAKQGGGDPNANFSLRLAIDKAKAAGVPKDNIERAIKSGTGEDGDGKQLEELMYEGYGPGGVALLIKVVTDNKNRAASDIKHILSKNGGSLGASGCVLWMFQQWGMIEIPKEEVKDRDDFEMKMIEANVQDIAEDEDIFILKTKPEELHKVLDNIKDYQTGDSGLEWIAKDKIKVEAEVEGRLNKLFGELEENEDVEEFYTNAE